MTFKPGETPKIITSAKQAEHLNTPGRYRDPEVRGLYLQVSGERNRSWLLRYQFEGRPRAMGLGPFPEVGLTAARRRALEIRDDLRRNNRDPLATREAERAALAALALEQSRAQTFKEAAEGYYQKTAAEWKTDDQRRAFRNTMERYVFPVIGNLNVAAIDTPDVLRVLEPIWQAKPAVAALLRVRIEGILARATVSGFRSGDVPNPARWPNHLALMLPAHSKVPKAENHAALPYAEIPRFMAALRAQDDLAAKALQFIILTAARPMEALGATWAEIDLDAKLWTVPAERMKGKREHVVPLSAEAIVILRSLPREDGNPYVFVGARQGAALSIKSVRATLKRFLGDSGDATIHGFRSSFRDWTGDKTTFQREVAEAALAHSVGDKTEKAYRRSDALEKRRALMEAWAGYCASTPGEDGKVLPFKAKV